MYSRSLKSLHRIPNKWLCGHSAPDLRSWQPNPTLHTVGRPNSGDQEGGGSSSRKTTPKLYPERLAALAWCLFRQVRWMWSARANQSTCLSKKHFSKSICDVDLSTCSGVTPLLCFIWDSDSPKSWFCTSPRCNNPHQGKLEISLSLECSCTGHFSCQSRFSQLLSTLQPHSHRHKQANHPRNQHLKF